jgi:hypothetical protein
MIKNHRRCDGGVEDREVVGWKLVSASCLCGKEVLLLAKLSFDIEIDGGDFCHIFCGLGKSRLEFNK